MDERRFIRLAWAFPAIFGVGALTLKLLFPRFGYAKPVFWLMFGGLAWTPVFLLFLLWSRNRDVAALRRASVSAPAWTTIIATGVFCLNPIIWLWTALARPLQYLGVVAATAAAIAAATYGYLGLMVLLRRALFRSPASRSSTPPPPPE